MRLPMKYYNSFLLLLINNILLHANGFILKSSGTGGLATGLAYDRSDDSFLIVGTLYHDNFWDLDSSAINDDTSTKCFIVQTAVPNTASSGSGSDGIRKRASTILSNPQICVGGAQIIDHGNSGFAAIMGTSGPLANIQLLSQPNYNLIEPSSSYSLSQNKIPVASTVHQDKYLFVATQNTAGMEFVKQVGMSNTQALMGLFIEYWMFLTQAPVSPAESNFQSEIEIVKYDTDVLSDTDGDNDFVLVMTVQDGYAVASAIRATDDYLIVAGSTNGQGDAFGVSSQIPSSSGNNDNPIWDGYVSFFDFHTAQLVSAIRIDTNTDLNDYVRDICLSPDLQTLYIVGANENDASGDRGFIVKLDVATRQIQWTLPISGAAVKCVADDDAVYVGRYLFSTYNVPIIGPLKSQNIVLSKYNDQAGNANNPNNADPIWTRQLDTSVPGANDIRQDYLVGLELNLATNANNVVALINSINFNGGLNDVILLEFLRDTGRNDMTDGTNGQRDPTGEIPTEPQNDDERIPGDENLGNDLGGDNDDKNNMQTEKEREQKTTAIWLSVLIPVLIGMWVMAYHVTCNEKEPIPPPSSSQQQQRRRPPSSSATPQPPTGEDANDLSLEVQQQQREVV